VPVSSVDHCGEGLQGWVGSCCVSKFTGKKSQWVKRKMLEVVTAAWSCNSRRMHHGVVFFCLADPKWIIADPEPAAV